MDRAELNRALAKAIAFKQAGKQAEAEQWAHALVELLECTGILRDADSYGRFAGQYDGRYDSCPR